MITKLCIFLFMVFLQVTGELYISRKYQVVVLVIN